MRDVIDFNRWSHDLAKVCHHFRGVAQDHQSAVKGRVTAHDLDGLKVADISGDVAAIRRAPRGAGQDDAEFIFCLIQASGRVHVDHNGELAPLGAGDCVLVDSTKDCRITLLQPGRLLLLHMPRADFLGCCAGRVQIGQLLPADHPLAPTIRQQVQQVCHGWDHGAAVGRATSGLILGMIQLAFSNPVDFAKDEATSSKDCQLALALDLIQQNLTNQDLSLAWLAHQIGMSTRQVQRLFEAENTSFSSEVRDRRLTAAAARLRSQKTTRRIHISEVAFDSGFRDLSNFNRGFKSRFGMAPREYLETVA
ncbi:helix-turn-helix domain-containing protein [Roseovarius dicentrarchi]|uniref:helix-turn-helix domain-containing protein n=1 Tax=Roseovarius dicentrarchi TaxID=2250573 RepID=UPI000DEB1F71|nr:helix-turn-helix domain-containing protein [Roseovarius dicentrarchi]